MRPAQQGKVPVGGYPYVFSRSSLEQISATRQSAGINSPSWRKIPFKIVCLTRDLSFLPDPRPERRVPSSDAMRIRAIEVLSLSKTIVHYS